ncbi:MAG: 4Fe-4S binding protein [Candidatus Helarchaeota archaeon]
MIPSFSRSIDKKEQKIKMRLLTLETELIHNRDLCVGCGTCVIVCPKNAVQRGPVGASIRDSRKGDMEDLSPVLFDHNICSFCGTCSHLCPTGAITVLVDGKEHNQLINEKALPSLKITFIDQKNTEDKIRKYCEGEIELDLTNCPSMCSTCAIVCPTNALTIPKSEKGWIKTKKVEYDAEKCSLCGACVYACPSDCITIKRTKVLYEGEFTEPFWPNIVEKLTTPRNSADRKI